MYDGPYRTIAALFADAAGATVELAAPAEGFAAWPFPPPLLDAALQTAAAVASSQSDRTLVPFACAAIDLFAPASRARTIRAFPATAEPGDKAIRFDSWIVGDDGAAIVRLAGLVARPIAADRQRADTGIGACFYQPVWHAEPAATVHPTGEVLTIAASALPAPSDEAAAAALAEAATQAGTVVIALGRQEDPTLHGLLAFMRALKRAALLDRLRIVVVTEGAQHVVPNDDPPPFATAALGIVRVAARECARWQVSCVDIGDPSDRAAAIADPGDPRGREIAYRNGQRFVARLEHRPAATGRTPWRRGGHYAILGGAGGIGAELARDLATRHGARLTLIGRSPEDDHRRALVADIVARGGEALYLPADGADPDALTAALVAGRAKFGPIHGAIHSAIVMQDRALEHMDDARFDAAYRIKADGCAALAAATEADPLDFLLLFSSANAFAAMPGQANYVAGCLAKDGFGLRLARQGRPVRIINWGFWGEVGRVATPEYRARLAKAGVRPLTTEEGLDAIDLALAGEAVRVLVLKADEAALTAGPYQPHLTLLDEAVASYRDVLTGRRQATDVLFPGGSLDRVMPMYAGNPMVDHHTARAAQAIAAAAGPGARVLEFGGGTGGLTGVALPLLDQAGGVAEYRFTDLSVRFNREAERRFAPGRPWFATGLLDIGRDAASQGFEPGRFDVVAAANAIHATPSIGESLATVRGLLKPGGTIVLYEMTRLHDYVTATFGLLDGWWAATDQRLPHSPLLDADGWRRALAEAGFADVAIEGTRHGVIVARRPAMAAPSRNPLVRRREAARSTATPPPEHNDAILAAVIAAVCEALELPPAEIRADRAFSEYGTDSILSVDVIAALNRRLHIQLKPTILFSHTTPFALARHIAEDLKPRLPLPSREGAAGGGRAIATPEKLAPPPPPDLRPRGEGEAASIIAPLHRHATPEPIAIIGASGRFPGAPDLGAFWGNLAAGRDAVGPVPDSRWDHAALFDARPGTPGHTNCRDGGFLDDIDRFDPLFFNLSPAEATAMDPQQRLFLEESWRALEDAARAGPDLPGSNTGVFVGTVTGNYADVLRRAGTPVDAHGFMGNAAAMLAARVAFHFDLTGPALSIDTACSSALVAIHQACESLRSGGCDMALAGGVAAMTTASFYLAGASAGMLSPTGRCRTLDAAADGFVPGEGIGVFVLRRLRDALKDGDPIRGVIIASGVNQDGASNGITAPNGAAQTRLIREAYARYGIDPASIGAVELHGTGTRLGDPIEMEALAAAYAGAAPPEGGWHIGSAKSGIGHALAAAGAAGLAKALLSLEHAALPPTLHLRSANPLLDFGNGAFRPVTEPTPWPRAIAPRRMAVSAFGFGGTNAHLVIEEAPPVPMAAPDDGTPLPIVLSAESPTALAASMDALAVWLAEPERNARLADIAATLAAGRRRMRHRAVFVARHIDELRHLLRDPAARQAAEASSEAEPPSVPGRRIHLPTYRFDRRRCWPEAAAVKVVKPRQSVVGRIVADLENLHFAGMEAG